VFVLPEGGQDEGESVALSSTGCLDGSTRTTLLPTQNVEEPITETTLGTIVCLISSLLVRWLEKGRVIFLRVWPCLILIWLIQGVVDAQVMVNRMETVNPHALCDRGRLVCCYHGRHRLVVSLAFSFRQFRCTIFETAKASKRNFHFRVRVQI
jgi:hypothetical protein